MRTLLATLLCLVTALPLRAQQQTVVTATVRDSLTLETEPYATVRVYRGTAVTRKPVAMSVADADGRVSQTLPAGAGAWLLTFGSMGKREARRTVVTTAAGGRTDLGDVLMEADAQTLEGVEVVAQKPVVRMEPDKMTYSVEDDAESKTVTLLDMMRKVPMVTVDAQDNIKVNNSSSFKVYVDGKPNAMYERNLSQICRATPASVVKSVEVITHPGARYDAEGTSGVLNIVLQGKDAKITRGYNGSVGMRVNNLGLAPTAYLGGQQGRLTYTANAFYSRNKTDGVTLDMWRDQYSDRGTSHTENRADEAKATNDYLSGNLSLQLELDTMSTLGASLSLYHYANQSSMLLSSEARGGMYGEGYAYGCRYLSEYKGTGLSVSADYQRYLNPRRTSQLTLSYLLSRSPQHDESTRGYDQGATLLGQPLTDTYSDAYTRSLAHTVQADLTLELNKQQTLSLGAKYIARSNISDSHAYSLATGERQENAAARVDFENAQNIGAAYAEHVLKAGKWKTRAGLRYEHTWDKMTYATQPERDFSRHYGVLVPTATVGYTLSDKANIGLNYAMRIWRPSATNINPYVDSTTPMEKSYGNPELDVEKAHSLSLVYSYYTAKLMLNASLDGSLSNNNISDYHFIDDEGVYNNTYANNAAMRRAGLSLYMRWVASKSTTVAVNAATGYMHREAEALGLKNCGWTANTYLSLEQQLPWKMRFSSGLFMMTRQRELRGYSKGMQMLSLSLSKMLAADRLRVALGFTCPLRAHIVQHTYERTPEYASVQHIEVPLQVVGLNLTWNFGNTKKQYSKMQSRVKNDFGETQGGGIKVGGGM